MRACGVACQKQADARACSGEIATFGTHHGTLFVDNGVFSGRSLRLHLGLDWKTIMLFLGTVNHCLSCSPAR